MTELHQWSDIADDFRETLVLGNGASVAVHSEFRYSSLKEEARSRGFFTSNEDTTAEDDAAYDVEDVFRLLGTEDFELVLNLLWHAKLVNDAFSIDDLKTGPAYELVKDALIKTVREVHCTRAQIEEHLENIYPFMGRFETVLSLSYDLIVYWALLAGINNLGPGRFKDCFTWERTFAPDWAEQRTWGADGKPTSTLVFYPHGNIVLFKRPQGGERKIVAGPDFLLNRILSMWKDDERIPLFVSEGLSEQKKDRIDNSPYLNRVYNEVMMDSGDTVAIYGWDMKDNDQHLVNRLFGKPKSKVAVSIHEPTTEDLEGHCHRIKRTILDASPLGHKPEISFFDAESDGCWIHS